MKSFALFCPQQNYQAVDVHNKIRLLPTLARPWPLPSIIAISYKLLNNIVLECHPFHKDDLVQLSVQVFMERRLRCFMMTLKGVGSCLVIVIYSILQHHQILLMNFLRLLFHFKTNNIVSHQQQIFCYCSLFNICD